MKILYCNKYNFRFSGTEVYLFDLMQLMLEHGHIPALFSMASAGKKTASHQQHLVSYVDFKNGRKNLFESAHLALHAIYSRQARQRLRSMIRDFHPDVAHVRNIYHHLSPSILWELKSQGIPVLYHLNDFKLLCPSYNLVSHGQACEQCREGRFWRVVTEGCYEGPRSAAAVLAAEAYFHKWLHTYQKCVDRFLVPSEFVRAKLMENGWEADRIEVLPHFQKIPREVPAAPAPGAPILYFGRLSPEKGVTDLLRAMSRIRRIPLRIVGAGPQRAELEQLARSLGLLNAEFVGHVEGELLDHYIREAMFTVMPSRAYETLGKTILESYAMGRPVIASDLGSRRELISESKTGFLFPVGDVEQLAQVISFLYDRPELATRMGRAGFARVEERHAPEAHYEAMLKLYRNMAAVPSSRCGQAVPSKPRVRVAFIGGRGVISKYSGIEAYYEEAGKRLAQLGHEVTVYCRNYFTPPQPEHQGMRIVRLPTIRSKHLETAIHTLLSTIHAAFSPFDIVHYHTLGPALFSFFPRWFGKKTVVTVQGLDWKRKKWGRCASAVLRLGERAAIRFPNATMVVSRTLQEHFAGRYGAPTSYIPNGATLYPHGEAHHLSQWGLEQGKYILFLGRFSPEKNCHLLIEAYERVHTDVKLVMAGGSSHTGQYVQELRTHASERILLLDWVSGEMLAELLTHATLFVLPSDLEGLSLALLDAMGAGLCVLASDIPENRELVESAGFTFKPGNVADLERMIRLLLSDAQVRAQAGRSAQEKIRAHYQWPEITVALEKVYFSLMRWTPPRPVIERPKPIVTSESETACDRVAP